MCDYFILTKPKDKTINGSKNNQIISLEPTRTYILPKNNLSYYVTHGLFEEGLIDWSVQFCKNDKNMLDIGAHTGTYAISLAPYCNHVYAFEPQKMTYYALCGSVALSNLTNITCFQVGLGSPSQVGNQTLNIISVDGGGSTLHIGGNSAQILNTETIEIKTLDEMTLDNIGFIKMDVEENELGVLLGANETLKQSNYPPILFEMNVWNNELITYLQSLSYNVIRVNWNKNMYLATNPAFTKDLI